jgi:hypothetical protein
MRPALTKLQSVSTDGERRQRRRFYVITAVQLALASGVVVCALWLRLLPAVLTLVAAIILLNFYLLWQVTRLSGMQWAARERLRKTGYRVCHGCSYDLSSSPDAGVCPECGQEYTPEQLKEAWEASYKKMLEKVGR